MMVLIIPTLPIFHGKCSSQIAPAHCTPGGIGMDEMQATIYSSNPIERARLFRKENAKTIHLEFWDSKPWNTENLELIKEMRAAVDIPLGIWIKSLPSTPDELEPIFEAGANRVFLPISTSEEVLFEYLARFTCRKVVPTLDLTAPFEELLPLFRSKKVERIGIEVSSRDQLENEPINWERLAEVAEIAKANRIRITIMHGIKGYPDLRELQSISPVIDSLVLCRALNKNRFPCQLIWREIEENCAVEGNANANLWVNPLEGKPHL